MKFVLTAKAVLSAAALMVLSGMMLKKRVKTLMSVKKTPVVRILFVETLIVASLARALMAAPRQTSAVLAALVLCAVLLLNM